MSDYWGYHLQVDAKACNQNACYPNANKIYNFTKELVTAIDMVAFGEPMINHFGSDNKAGYTLVQLIETSNICAHFCDDTGDAYFDIFSCKEYDTEIVIDLIKKYFNPERIITSFRLRQA